MHHVIPCLTHNVHQNQQNHGVLAIAQSQPVLCIPMLKDQYLHATFQVILDDKLKPGIDNKKEERNTPSAFTKCRFIVCISSF